MSASMTRTKTPQAVVASERGQPCPRIESEAAVRADKAVRADVEMIGAKINLSGESLPDGWSVQLVGDIGEYINGYPFKPTEWKEEGLPIIRIQNLNDATKPFNYFPDRIDERHLVRDGDILISWSASLGTFLWRRGDGWLNQHIFKALPDDTKIDRSFFYWAMVYAIDRIAKNARGSTMVHVTGKEFKGSEILLPARVEQRMIAGVLTVVQRAMEQQERLLALTAELKKALLHQLFTAGLRGEPQKQTQIGPVPDSWEVVTIGDLFKFSSGKSRPEDTEQTASESRPFPVFGGNGVLGFSSRYLFEEPLLLIGRVGEYCGCAHHTAGRAWVSDNALYAKEILRETNTRYAVEYLNYANLNQYRNQAGQPLITQGVISQVKMPLPPVAQQREILEPLNLLNQKLGVAKRKHAALTDLFRTLLHQLMTARIRVHDLDIEPLSLGKQE